MRLSMSTIFKFQIRNISRALALCVGFGRESRLWNEMDMLFDNVKRAN